MRNILEPRQRKEESESAGIAMRSALRRVPVSLTRQMESSRGAVRCFSDGRGRVLGEEERAAENVYIQKMERERLEKLKRQAEKEKAGKEKEQSEKKSEGTQ